MSDDYPADWPRCTCGRPVLDGHLTCGRLECDEARARDRQAPCLHDWLDLATISHAEIDEADPVLHTTVVVLGCVHCRTVDLFPAGNAAMITPRFLDTIRRQLSTDGWQLP